jgi:hypothetical protein
LTSNLTSEHLMRNVNDDAPVLFRTRWAMSYLRGPLTLNEIKRLTVAAPAAATTVKAEPTPRVTATSGTGASRPVVQSGVVERFLKSPPASPSSYES